MFLLVSEDGLFPIERTVVGGHTQSQAGLVWQSGHGKLTSSVAEAWLAGALAVFSKLVLLCSMVDSTSWHAGTEVVLFGALGLLSQTALWPASLLSNFTVGQLPLRMRSMDRDAA